MSTTFPCPDCGETMTCYVARWGVDSCERHRCDNEMCEWKGTSYPTAVMLRRAFIDAVQP